MFASAPSLAASSDLIRTKLPQYHSNGLCLILHHTLAMFVAGTQTILSFSEILLGSFTKPTHRFHII